MSQTMNFMYVSQKRLHPATFPGGSAYVITRVEVTGIVMDAFGWKHRRERSLRRNAGAMCVSERGGTIAQASAASGGRKKSTRMGAFLVDCLTAGRRDGRSPRTRRHGPALMRADQRSSASSS